MVDTDGKTVKGKSMKYKLRSCKATSLHVKFHDNNRNIMSNFEAACTSDIKINSEFIPLFVGYQSPTFKDLRHLFERSTLSSCSEPPNPIIIDNDVVLSSIKIALLTDNDMVILILLNKVV